MTINELKVVSSPGHSFVPLYLTNDNCNDQAAADFADLVLKVISRFEKDNPNLKITSWKLQNGYKCEIVGIWIDHEMRYSITDSMNHKPQDQK